MRHFRILLILPILLMLTMACSLCDDMTSNGVFDRILGCDYSDEIEDDMVTKFPQSYAGAATIKTWNVCDSQANATLTVFEEKTCALLITYPMAFQNFEGLMPGDAGYGACKPNGDTQAYSINGRFSKDQQLCKFVSCNDQVYSATGSMLFNVKQATGLSDKITCINDKNGEAEIEIDINTLAPATP